VRDGNRSASTIHGNESNAGALPPNGSIGNLGRNTSDACCERLGPDEPFADSLRVGLEEEEDVEAMEGRGGVANEEEEDEEDGGMVSLVGTREMNDETRAFEPIPPSFHFGTTSSLLITILACYGFRSSLRCLQKIWTSDFSDVSTSFAVRTRVLQTPRSLQSRKDHCRSSTPLSWHLMALGHNSETHRRCPRVVFMPAAAFHC
jgi:hypothetical protein